MSISPQAPDSYLCTPLAVPPPWQEQVQQMMYSNVVSRRARRYVHESQVEIPEGPVDEMWYFGFLNELKAHGDICFVTGPICIPTTVGIAVHSAESIFLLRNPTHLKRIKSSQGMLAVMDIFTMAFVDVLGDPVQYWQEVVEPVGRSAYSFR